ncbi:hypothetical protein CXR25_02970 [Brevibacterium aurantiacum]|nr:hypothetical protein CXR25_02970 [Brevibacterium aurantiacum]
MNVLLPVGWLEYLVSEVWDCETLQRSVRERSVHRNITILLLVSSWGSPGNRSRSAPRSRSFPLRSALLLPVAITLPAELSLPLMVSLYLGAEYGGRISAILLNIPGDPGAIMTTLDGHPMALKGKGRDSPVDLRAGLVPRKHPGFPGSGVPCRTDVAAGARFRSGCLLLRRRHGARSQCDSGRIGTDARADCCRPWRGDVHHRHRAPIWPAAVHLRIVHPVGGHRTDRRESSVSSVSARFWPARR